MDDETLLILPDADHALADMPEYRLVATLLQLSLMDCVRKDSNAKSAKCTPQVRQEALEWLFSEDTHEFSARWCAELLGLEIEPFREQVKNHPHHVRSALMNLNNCAA